MRDVRNLFIEHLTLSMFWLEIASAKFLFQFTIVQMYNDCARAGRILKISINSAKNSLVNIFKYRKKTYIARYILYVPYILYRICYRQSYIADSDGLRRLPMEIGKEFSCFLVVVTVTS